MQYVAALVMLACIVAVIVVSAVLIFAPVLAERDRGAVLGKAFLSLLAWAFLSFAMYFAFFWGAFLGGLENSPHPDAFKGAVILTISGLIYISIGYGLARWVLRSGNITLSRKPVDEMTQKDV